MPQPEVVRFGGLDVDLRCLPVVVVRYSDAQTGADFVRMAEEVTRLAQERRWIGMIHDTTRLTKVLGAADRKLMRDAVDRLVPLMDTRAVGAAVIIRNPLVRGAMTAAKWFMSQKYEEKVFATAREGADWIVLRFAEVNAPLPPVAVSRLFELAEARTAA